MLDNGYVYKPVFKKIFFMEQLCFIVGMNFGS